MRRNLAAATHVPRTVQRSVSSVACLAFVIVLASAFWAGALWIGKFLIHVSALGF